MFVLKSLGKFILGNKEQINLLQLENGQLWISEASTPTASTKAKPAGEAQKAKQSVLVINRTRAFDRGAKLILRRAKATQDPSSKRERNSLFAYELVVTSEHEHAGNDENDEEDVDTLDNSSKSSSPYVFPVGRELNFVKGQFLEALTNTNDKSALAFSWNDPQRVERTYSYVIDKDKTSSTTIDMFHVTMAQCIYETIYQKSHTQANDQDIEQFLYSELEPIIEASEANTAVQGIMSKRTISDWLGNERIVFKSGAAGFYLFDGENNMFVPQFDLVQAVISSTRPEEEPVATKEKGKKKKASSTSQVAENFTHFLNIFYLKSLNADKADEKTAADIDEKNVSQPLNQGPDQDLTENSEQILVHRQLIDPDATLHTDRNSGSFVWCYYSGSQNGDGASFVGNYKSTLDRIWTFSLRFRGPLELMAFSNAMGQAVYETLNNVAFSKLSLDDASYLLNPFIDDDVEMATVPNPDESDHDNIDKHDTPTETNHHLAKKKSSLAQIISIETDSDSSEQELAIDTDSSSDDSSVGFFKTRGSSAIDSDSEEENGYRNFKSTEMKNSQLAVGFKNDRSFVSRGNSIGVFKHTSDEKLKLHAKIDKVSTAKGKKTFTPSKMMLHDEDRSLILMNPTDPHNLYKMDLERGQVVEEWNIHPDATVKAILPDSKYAQMTANPTLIGLNSNSIFRIDPRLPGSKRVDQEMKQYVVKNEFSCGATTGSGELAVASEKGEIRLFDKIDKRAKTLLPGFGDPIIGIDVTESGRYIVATCKTYLLLICTEIPGQAGALGFHRSMGGRGGEGTSAEKPKPKRLTLKPEHVAFMGAEISFTPARFSTGQSEERSIITSTGPYVITWNLRLVKQGRLFEYQIKKYPDNVVADNFRFGQDRSIVVTLPDHVTMISKKSLSMPSPKVFKQDI